MTARARKLLCRAEVAAINAMTDAELSAFVGNSPQPDWTGFTDNEVEALANDTASQELWRKFDEACAEAEIK